nr:MAG TPA: hypothetical protein [Bacteriophage sp.]
MSSSISFSVMVQSSFLKSPYRPITMNNTIKKPPIVITV